MSPNTIRLAAWLATATLVAFGSASAQAAGKQGRTVYEFQDGSGKSAGANPEGALLVDGPALVGTTTWGGPPDDVSMEGGTVYTLTKSAGGGWKHTAVFAFDVRGALGYASGSGLTKGADGKYYGVTTEGAASDHGAVFRLTPARGGWTGELVHAFAPQDGYAATGELVADARGNLFGTLSQGGDVDCGALFELRKSHDGFVYRTIHAFQGGVDGCGPNGRLVFGSDGSLYGATGSTVFRVASPTTSTTVETLHAFAGADGEFSHGGLAIDADGSLYGTTSQGGANGGGTLFKLAVAGPAPTFELLHAFGGDADTRPQATVIIDGAGNLFGTTAGGGIYELAKRADAGYDYAILATMSGYDTFVLAPLSFLPDGRTMIGSTLGEADGQAVDAGRLFTVVPR